MSEFKLSHSADLGWCVDGDKERIPLYEYYKRQSKERGHYFYIKRFSPPECILDALMAMGFEFTLVLPKEEDNVQTQED